MAQLVKNPPAVGETWVRSLGWEDPLEKGTATHSSILAWRTPWRVHGVKKSRTQLSAFHYYYITAAAAKSLLVVSDSVQPHRRQPTRLPHPWDSPGKNTGVGYHFLLQCMKMKSESEVA